MFLRQRGQPRKQTQWRFPRQRIAALTTRTDRPRPPGQFIDGCLGAVGISTSWWQNERSSRVSPRFSEPKTRATRPPRAISCSTNGASAGSETTGCSGFRWASVPVPITSVQSATASAGLAASCILEQLRRPERPTLPRASAPHKEPPRRADGSRSSPSPAPPLLY